MFGLQVRHSDRSLPNFRRPFTMSLKMLLVLPSLSQLQVWTQIYQQFKLVSLVQVGICIF
jgi:hypothetical protein